VTGQSTTWLQQAHLISAPRPNGCVTVRKTTMTAGKIYHGCFDIPPDHSVRQITL